MIINRVDAAVLAYEDKVMVYNGKKVVFRFPEYVTESTNLTFTEADMGEAVLTLDVKIPAGQEPEFNLNWTIRFRGETYHLRTLSPPAKKDNQSLQYVYTLTFVSERDELKHRLFAEFHVLEDGSLQLVKQDFAFFGTLEEYVARFNQNLQYHFPYRWRMQLNPDIEVNPIGVTVAANKASMWTVLTQCYELYDVRWSIVEDNGELVIMVGYPAPELDYIFEYNDGLLGIQRVNPLPDIFTRLYGRGSTRNLPYRYFKQASGTFPGDPDWNAELSTAYFERLMPSSYRSYVQGWNDAKAGRQPSTDGDMFYGIGYSDQKAGRKLHPTAYAQSDNVVKWGVREGVIDDNDEIYPTIQNVWLPPLNGSRRGRADELVAIEAVTNDDWEATGSDAVSTVPAVSTKITFKSGSRTGTSTVKTEVITTSASRNVISFQLDMSWSALRDDMELDGQMQVRLYDNSNQLVDTLDFTRNMVAPRTRIPAQNTGSFTVALPGNYRLELYTSMSYNGSFTGLRFKNGWVAVELNSIQNRIQAGVGEFKEVVDIWIKDIWGETGTVDQVWGPKIASKNFQGEATVMFSDGMLAGNDYELKIAKDPKLGNPESEDRWCIWRDTSRSITTVDEDGTPIVVQSGWRLSVIKTDAERDASGLYLPNQNQTAKPGDHFFFVYMELPWQYVYWAEQKLQDWLEAEVARVDDEFPTFAITPSSIFFEMFGDIDSIQTGTRIRIRNVPLIGESYLSLYINSLTIRYTEGKLLPQWSAVISEEMVANNSTTDKIQGEIRRLSSNIYSSQQSILEMTRQFERTFLRKDGKSDTSYSDTTFAKNVTFESLVASETFAQGDFAGTGWGIYEDSTGASVMEVDKLVVRREMRVNEIVINQVTFIGGKQIFSAAGSQIERVENIPGNLIKIAAPTLDTSIETLTGWEILVERGTVEETEFNGIKCAKITATETAGSVGLTTYLGEAQVVPNESYTLSVDIYPTGTGNFCLSVGNPIIWLPITDDMVGKWTRLNVTSPSTNVLSTTRIRMYSQVQDNPIYLSKFKIEIGSIATPYSSSAYDVFRCYIDTKEGTLLNHFAIDDQAYHQQYDPADNSVISYYWRLVAGVGPDYVDLLVDYSHGSSVPQAGDNIAQLGNRSNTSRQSAIVIDVVRDGGGLMTWYDDINGFTLTAKDSINIGRLNGKTWAQVFGNMYIGNREESKYLKYEDGNLIFRGDIFEAAADVSRIIGNFLVTGYLGLSPDGTETGVLAGISAVDLASPNPIPEGYDENQDKIRYFAGSTFARRKSAPYQVWQDGTLYVRDKAYIGKGHIGFSGLDYDGKPYGGFEIADGRIGVYSSSTENSGQNNGLAIYNDFIKFSNSKAWVGMGMNVISSTVGWTGYFRLEADHRSDGVITAACGIYVRMQFDTDIQSMLWNTVFRHAIHSEGNFWSLGGHTIWNDLYMGQAYSNIIQALIGLTHTYTFTSTGIGTYAGVELPTPAQIREKAGLSHRSNSGYTFYLKIQCAYNMPNKIIVYAPSGTSIRGNKGNLVYGASGDNGVDLVKGNTLILHYYNGVYSIVAYAT